MVEIDLPRGLELEGSWHRRAALRPLNGADETFLQEEGSSLTPPAKATAILARCLAALGPLAPVPEAAVRRLAVGDRDALLLQLRRLAFGDRISCVVTCPELACAQKMDLDLGVGDLLVPAYQVRQVVHDVTLSRGSRSFKVRFRLPEGRDLEAVAGFAASDPAGAAPLLLQRCLVQVEGEPEVADLAIVEKALPALMAALDPQADIELAMRCSECGREFEVGFDAGAQFFTELAAGLQHLYQEVHVLALHYHWPESEILGLSARKRRRYLGLLADALGRG